MRWLLLFLLMIALPARAGTVAAVYFNANGEITMVVIPDDDAELTDPANAAAFAPKGQTRVLVPYEMFGQAKSERDLKEIGAMMLSKGNAAAVALADKLGTSVLNEKAAEEAKARIEAEP